MSNSALALMERTQAATFFVAILQFRLKNCFGRLNAFDCKQL